jgi:hypothetical protein
MVLKVQECGYPILVLELREEKHTFTKVKGGNVVFFQIRIIIIKQRRGIWA